MRDFVLVPTFNRPEYLALCLEHIAKADGGRDKHVWVSHDKHVQERFPDVERNLELSKEVVAAYHNTFASFRFIVRTPHQYWGNPCNFLETYHEAYIQDDGRYIYLIEDDVLIAKDFFRWHEAVQARQREMLPDYGSHAPGTTYQREPYFCTVGWHDVRNPLAKIDPKDPLGYLESTRDFSSIGVCWRRESLAHLVKHATAEYYRNMGHYLARTFPRSPIPPGQWTEQAGVITRMLHETCNRWVAWPLQRRCSHVGVSGYHRPNGFRFGGRLDERISALRRAVATDTIVGMNKDFGGDIEPLLEPLEWRAEDLQVVQRFPYEKGKI